MLTISIITPTLNQATFIGSTIESVLSQKGDFALEYIVMDGGSIDGTVAILEGYGDRIIWRSEPDSGQANAINKGMRLATGDIVAYLNSDDVYLPGALQKVAAYFARNPDCEWLFGRCRIIGREGHEIRRAITAYKNFWLWIKSRYIYAIENFISQPATFWRRSAMVTIGGFDESLHLAFDYDYWMRFWARFVPGHIKEDIAEFRWYETSKSGSTYVRQFHEEYEIARQHSAPMTAIWLHKLNIYKIIWTYNLLSRVRRKGHDCQVS